LKKINIFQNITIDFSLLIKKSTMYDPTSNEKYINIDKESKITLYKNDVNSNNIYKIHIGIYSIDELESILNVDNNDDFITVKINDKN